MSTPPKAELPFPPLTKRHILNCSYAAWHPRYRTLTPKTRTFLLPKPFLDYLRADGIVVPDEPSPSDPNEKDPDDPSREWPETHEAIASTIKALGGVVAPKLNWSAPKDATWINPVNTMECRSPNDIYMMLKSSDFITHDLEHAFDGCVPSDDQSADEQEIPHHLVLRKWVSAWNPSVEFRCFVRDRKLLGICQRDLNHYDFLFDLRPKILQLIREFFGKQLKDSFSDENFAFDVYVPQPYNRVWLVDINPWAVRTDPILFSWLELLEMEDPVDEEELEELDGDDFPEGSFVRIPLRTGAAATRNLNGAAGVPAMPPTPEESEQSSEEIEDDDDDQPISGGRTLELRLIKKGDPEGLAFNTPQYSAHKLPREVVDASSGGYDPEQMKDFAEKWQELVKKGEAQKRGEDVSTDEEDAEAVTA